jgi:uncharacterized protein YndB with AHSA1/START domain
MAPLVSTIEIARSPEDVFAYVTDPGRFMEWQEGLVAASEEGNGPRGAGSRVKMTRKMGPREQTFTVEVTEYEPPRSWAIHGIDGPVRPVGRGTIERVGDGTSSRLTFELDFEGHGIGKVLVPLVVRRQSAGELKKNHQNLKRNLESGGRETN